MRSLLVSLKWLVVRLMNSVIILMCLSLQVQSVYGDILPENPQTKQWMLWAKPRICVIPLDLTLCEMETEIHWTGHTKANICLLSSEKNATVHCWNDAQQGHLLQSITMDKQITYWLAYLGEKEVLVETHIRLISFPQKRARRRRRHIWSLL